MKEKIYVPKRQKIIKSKLHHLELSFDIPSATELNETDEPQTKLLLKEVEAYGFNKDLTQNALLPGAFAKYKDACECGERFENNCAHFLSNAFLLQDPNIRFPAGLEKCTKGRLKRAKEMLAWFRTLNPQFKENHTGITDYYWFVYEESPVGQGHVCIHLEKNGNYDWRGTTDIPNWPV